MTMVYTSSVIDEPAADVWSVVRDFNALPVWFPLIVESRIEQNKMPDQIGCIRNFRLTDGGLIREQLLSLSDYDFSFTYSILESPMPLRNYVASFRLYPVTDGGRCFGEWSARFECAEADRTALIQQVGTDVFQGGFNALKAYFK